jgi:hypothetical protein
MHVVSANISQKKSAFACRVLAVVREILHGKTLAYDHPGVAVARGARISAV